MANLDFKKEIEGAARKSDDVRLSEAVHAYLLSIENVDFLPWKKLKSFFVAARSKDSYAWLELSGKEASAIENVLVWTGYSPNTIAVILRIYERSTPELKKAQQEGRISRYTADSISRLYKGKLKELQPQLLEMCLRYELSNTTLKKLVQELQRTINEDERNAILKKYTPSHPPQLDTSTKSLITETPTTKPNKLVVDDGAPLYLFVSDISKLSDNELWRLKEITEAVIQQPTSVLKKSLEHIKKELKKRL